MNDEIEWNKDLAIAACVEIVRSPKATPSDIKDAKNMILLMVGASDGFKDQNGRLVVSAREFVRRALHSRQAQNIMSDLGMAKALKSRELLISKTPVLAHSNTWARASRKAMR